MTNFDIVITGVGGQGTLLASKILGQLALLTGHDVKVSEVHGMAQRGGSVVTYVRIGENIASPLVEAGGADYVLAFELLEAARAKSYLKEGGTLIANTQEILPMPVITGLHDYPSDLDTTTLGGAVLLNALALAEQAGVAKAVNIVLIGALCAKMKGDVPKWREAIAKCVPEKFLAANLRAFELGREAVS